MRSYLHTLTTSVVSSGDGDGGRIPILPYHFNWVMISMSSKPQKEISHLLKLRRLSSLQLDFPVPVYFSCGICGNESTFNLIA